MRFIILGAVIPGSIGGLTRVVLPALGLYGYGIADYLTVFMAFFVFRAFSIE